MEEENPQTKNPNSNLKTTKQHNAITMRSNTKKKNIEEFEFCKVCNYSHDQGQRHKYFPNHAKSLLSFLSRFQNKLSDVKFFLNNPTFLLPEHSSRNRLWCVFCDSDIDELGSSFACSKAINHLASLDHLKNLKSFLWKNGGEMDRIDSFTISNTDFNKWEKKCMTLKSEAASVSEGSRGNLIGPSNEMRIIRYQSRSCLMLKRMDIVYMMLPLLCQCLYNFLPILRDQSILKVIDAQWVVLSMLESAINQVSRAKRIANGESSYQGLQTPNQVSALSIIGDAIGNVHSGAPPPWLEVIEIKPKSGVNTCVSALNKPGKSHKLNPKRVGAAWAEKRKLELELEKRGEIVENNCDENWLPNFGRVWQSGSRKESRKEFEKEKQKSPNVESQVEIPIKIQPYISKRMRLEEKKYTSSID